MPIYMQYEGIDGDSTTAGHEKWIMLESCQFGVNRHISSPSGRGVNREAASPSVSEIVITKSLDCASANMFKASLWGEGKKVKIDFCKTDKDKIDVYLQIELENTMVSSFNASGHGGDQNSKPMESLSLNFTKITFKTILMDDKNKAGKPQVANWDLAALKGA